MITKPSKFKDVEVLRQNAEISWTSVLRLSVQAHHEEVIAANNPDKKVLLEISFPVSAGTLRKDVCLSGLN